MGGDWSSALPIILVGIGVLLIPGGALGYAIGLRGFAVLAVAPLLTTSIAAVGGVLFRFVNVPYNPITVGFLTVACTLGATFFYTTGLASGRIRPRTIAPRADFRTVVEGLAGLIVVAIAGTIVLFTLIDGPEQISQQFDGVFHLNEIWHIVQTHNGSSLWGNQITTSTGSAAFYPIAWHVVTALLVQLTGAPVTVAVNAMVYASLVVGWGSGVLFLAQTLSSRGFVRTAAAGTVAFAFSAFPLILLTQGVVYPLAYAVCLFPSAIALVLHALGRAAAPAQRPGASLFALFASLPGIGLAHPSIALVVWAIVVIVTVPWLLHRVRSRQSGVAQVISTGVIVIGVIANALAFAWGWMNLRPDVISAAGRCQWDTCPGALPATMQWLLQTQLAPYPLVVLAVLVLVGAAVAWRRGQHWAIIVWAAGGFAFIQGASGPGALWRDLLTGVFYQDTFRVAALSAVLSVPLALMGVDAVMARILRAVNQFDLDRFVDGYSPMHLNRPSGVKPLSPFSAFVVFGVLVALAAINTVAVVPHAAARSANYRYTADSQLLTVDERALLDRLGKYVPKKARIFGNPGTGASLAYAIAHRETVPYYQFSELTPAADVLRESFNDPDMRKQVCNALDELGVSYILDFGTQVVNDGKWTYPGIEDLGAPYVKVVAKQGSARLLKITICQEQS